MLELTPCFVLRVLRASRPRASARDITALLNAGILDRTESGGIIFPFETIKVEFLLEAA